MADTRYRYVARDRAPPSEPPRPKPPRRRSGPLAIDALFGAPFAEDPPPVEDEHDEPPTTLVEVPDPPPTLRSDVSEILAEHMNALPEIRPVRPSGPRRRPSTR